MGIKYQGQLKIVIIITIACLISASGRKISTKCNDLRESTFLFQRLAITFQRFNSVLLQESVVCDPDKWQFQLFVE